MLLVFWPVLRKQGFLQRDGLPTSLWAASSQLLDVTAFPNWKNRPASKPEKTWPEKTGKKKAALKPREGLRRRCCRRHGFSKKSSAASQGAVHRKVKRVTDSGNARAWHIYGEKPERRSARAVVMRGEGTAARGVPVRQIQLQKSMMDGRCSFLFR